MKRNRSIINRQQLVINSEQGFINSSTKSGSEIYECRL